MRDHRRGTGRGETEETVLQQKAQEPQKKKTDTVGLMEHRYSGPHGTINPMVAHNIKFQIKLKRIHLYKSLKEVYQSS